LIDNAWMLHAPLRRVENAEALAWLAANPAPEGACVVTSMPDVSEVPLDLAGWREWFIGAARTIVRWLPPEGVAIFSRATSASAGRTSTRATS
jgi:hypothetical protein